MERTKARVDEGEEIQVDLSSGMGRQRVVGRGERERERDR